MTGRWPRAILHLDMDAFFVNVHLLDHPEDAGLPLVVGGRPEERGVVASASYEARRFGIGSAMATSIAVRRCPELRIVDHDWPRIRECSRAIMATLREYGPVEQMSVDEAYVDLSLQAKPEPLAPAIRDRVKRELRLPASVGLATAKLVAKVASDYHKPEGCTIVLPGDEAAFLAPLPTRVLWGIGPATAGRLADLGIHHCRELASADPALLRAHFGQQGPLLRERAQGIDPRPVRDEPAVSKSISQERTFSHDVADTLFLKRQLWKMCRDVATSLHEQSLVARTVTVKFRRADFSTFTRQKTVVTPVNSAEEIYRLSLALWQAHWPPGRPMRLLGVGVANLEESPGRQLSLFEAGPA
jgi:DNA polymerase-4